MIGIRRIKEKFEETRKEKEKALYETFFPIDELPEFPEKKIDPDVFRAIYDPSELIYLDQMQLIEPKVNLYHYNAGLYQDTDKTYRMFYRCGKNPKAYEDRVATCLLDKNLNIISGTNKYLDLHSSWKETTHDNIHLKRMIPYIFKDGTHVEDPRAIKDGDNWFIFYTDGIHMGVAKIDKKCDVVYSHYLSVPTSIKHDDSDGREKNWIPIKIQDGHLYVLYSESPRVIFKYKDYGTGLKLIQTKTLAHNLEWKHGYIRGGCPPVDYEEDKYIWFFHSVKMIPTYVSEYSRVYMIGAYVTENKYPYKSIKITLLPILIGWPSKAVSKLILQDNVVFPCGAIKKSDNVYIICMGINDYKIAHLEVNVSDFLWKQIPNPVGLYAPNSTF
jgi:predicted GH43/DUF377 family glycosyl hydrolase